MNEDKDIHKSFSIKADWDATYNVLPREIVCRDFEEKANNFLRSRGLRAGIGWQDMYTNKRKGNY